MTRNEFILKINLLGFIPKIDCQWKHPNGSLILATEDTFFIGVPATYNLSLYMHKVSSLSEIINYYLECMNEEGRF